MVSLHSETKVVRLYSGNTEGKKANKQFTIKTGLMIKRAAPRSTMKQNLHNEQHF